MKKFECEMLEENPRELFQRNPTPDLELWGPGPVNCIFWEWYFFKGQNDLRVLYDYEIHPLHQLCSWRR